LGPNLGSVSALIELGPTGWGPTGLGNQFGICQCTHCAGAYGLGAYRLGAYMLGQPNWDQEVHSLTKKSDTEVSF
jgi:hypothetical protein